MRNMGGTPVGDQMHERVWDLFDHLFFCTESLRFYGDIHDGKKAIVEMIGERVRGKTVLDFGCGGGHYTKMLAQTASTVYGLDSETALFYAREFNGAPNIVYTAAPPATDVTVFFDCLELIPNWKETFERYKSPVNYIICPNFGGMRYSRLTSYLKRLAANKRTIPPLLEKVEGKRYHKAVYNKKFVKEFEEAYVGAYEVIPFMMGAFPFSSLFTGRAWNDHLLYVVRG